MLSQPKRYPSSSPLARVLQAVAEELRAFEIGALDGEVDFSERLVRREAARGHGFEDAVGRLADHQVFGDPAAPFVIHIRRGG